MDLDDLLPGMPVRARGDGGLGGVPGELVGVVAGVDGEYLRLSLAGDEPERDPEDHAALWVPLSWVDREHGGELMLTRTLTEFRRSALREPPAVPGHEPTSS